MVPLRLLVADDHDIVRVGLRNLLESQPGWQVVAEASNGRDAVQKAIDTKPAVTLLDIGMPVLNGLEAARQILKSGVNTKILILTMYDSETMIREVLAVGARGYLLKTDAATDLVAAVEAARCNKTFFTASVGQIVLDGYLKSSDSRGPSINLLTPRQREIVRLLAEGRGSKGAAACLGLSTKTVETHRANIMHRLNCHSIADLVHYALRNKIIEA